MTQHPTPQGELADAMKDPEFRALYARALAKADATLQLAELKQQVAERDAQAATMREALEAWVRWTECETIGGKPLEQACDLTEDALASDAGRALLDQMATLRGEIASLHEALGKERRLSQGLRGEIAELVARMDADAVLLGQAGGDQQRLRSELAHVAQTVHQGYHQDQDHTWHECSIAFCADVRAVLGEER